MNLSPHGRAYADGIISADAYAAAMWREELALAKEELAECRRRKLPMATRSARRNVARAYIKLRELREWVRQ